MASKRRFARAIMVLGALAIVLIGLSYFGVHYYSASDDSGQSASTQSSSADSLSSKLNEEADDNADIATDQASDASEDQSAAVQGKKDAKAQQEQGESVEDDAAEDERDTNELSIAGAVLDNVGLPLDGASVVAELVSDASQEETTEVYANQHSETTDHLGMFKFSDLDEGEYELTASKSEEFFPARTKVRTGMANAELILQRIRPVRVYGTVSDQQQAPLDAVSIRALGSKVVVTSDANGRYEIVTAPMRAGTAPVLHFEREDYQDTRRRVEAALDSENEEVQLDVQMEADSDRPKVAVAGQVLGPVGEAVIGVRVGLKSFKSDRGYSARTDDSGEFSIPEAEVGEGYRLNVMPSEAYEAYQSDVFSLEHQDAFFEIELEAAKSASLSGTVTDLYGKPLREFQLWLRGIGTSAQSTVAIRTDVTGRFRLDNLRAGKVVLETRSRPLLRASNIVLEPDVHTDVTIPLDWGDAWLLGRVVDSAGEPVSGASIIVSWKAELHELTSDSRRDLRSDLEGYFTASNLAADHYTIMVQATGHPTYRNDHQLKGGAEELVIELQ